MKIELILALLLLPIASAVSDTTPPTLVSFDFEPKVVDVSQSDQNITFTAQIKDDLSGVSLGQKNWKSYVAHFSSPSGKQSAGVFFDDIFSGDDLNGTFVNNTTIGQYSESGKWKISELYLQDNLGNYKELNETEMRTLSDRNRSQIVKVVG